MYPASRKNNCRDVPGIGEYFVVLLMYMGACLIYSFTEERTTVNNGLGWDGEHYYNIARQYLDSGLNPFTVIVEEAPMRFRMGVPYLAAVAAWLLGTDLLTGFHLINMLAGTATVLMLYRLVRYFNPSVITGMVLLFFFIAHYYSPFRRSFAYPNLTDSVSAFFITALLFCIYNYMKRPGGRILAAICILTFFAVICREFMLALALGFVFAGNPFLKEPKGLPVLELRSFRPVYFLPLAFGVAGIALTHLLSRQSASRDDYHVWHQIGYFLGRNPLEYLHIAWIIFGPAAILLFFNLRRVVGFFIRWQPYMVYGISVVVMSYVGGTDVERFLFWAVPVYLCLLSYFLSFRPEQKARFAIMHGLVFIVQMFANRVFW